MVTVMGLVDDTSYGKQKSNLVRDFEVFLSANHLQGMDTASSSATACPSDVTKFLGSLRGALKCMWTVAPIWGFMGLWVVAVLCILPQARWIR